MRKAIDMNALKSLSVKGSIKLILPQYKPLSSWFHLVFVQQKSKSTGVHIGSGYSGIDYSLSLQYPSLKFIIKKYSL